MMRRIEGSKQIHAIGYDPKTRTLHVHFVPQPARKNRDGEPVPARPAQHYSYSDVSSEQHAAFMGAESKGQWFHTHLKVNPVSHPHTHHGDVPDDQTYS